MAGRAAADTDRAALGGVGRGGVLNLAAAGFSGLAGLAVTTLVARGLGHAQAGVFFAATSAFLLAQMLAKLGTDTGLVYWLARLRAVRRFDLLHRLLHRALLPVLVASVLAAVVLMVAAPYLARLPVLTGRHAQAGDFARQLRVLALFLPAAALSDTLLSATRGYRTMRPTALVDKVIRPSLQLAVLLVVLLSASTTLDTLAWAAPYTVSAVLAAWYLSTVDRTARSRPTSVSSTVDFAVPARLGAAFWRFTMPRALSSIAQIALQRLDVLLVAALLGFPAAALYTVATRFIVVGQLGNQAIGSAVQPRLAELLARHDYAAVRLLYQGSTAWVVLTTWPMYLLVGIFAPAYLGVFGAGYDAPGSAVVVAVLCLAMLAAGACGMVDMVLTMGGRTTWNLANVVLALAVNLSLDLALIPPMGIMGAAIGWAAAVLVKNLVPLAQIAGALRLHPFGRATAWAALLAVGCVGVPALGARLLLGPGLAGLVTAAAVAVPLYATACVLARHPLGLTDLLPRRITERLRHAH
ncbi:MAG TPA: polysaccharide biosynthesis C-terminal domain-containing protein [Actinocatenispora sp.]